MRGAGGGVEVAGGLVGQHHRRAAGDRPGDGDSLPFPARQLGRPGTGLVPQTHREPAQRRLAAAAGRGERRRTAARQRRCSSTRLVLGEEELLENEPEPGCAQRRQLPVGHPGHVQAGDQYRARRWACPECP